MRQPPRWISASAALVGWPPHHDGERLLKQGADPMDLLRHLFGIAFILLTSVALILALAIICLLEARYIVRITNELLLVRGSACRATCDR
jgi:hypothetical protein